MSVGWNAGDRTGLEVGDVSTTGLLVCLFVCLAYLSYDPEDCPMLGETVACAAVFLHPCILSHTQMPCHPARSLAAASDLGDVSNGGFNCHVRKVENS